MINELGDFDIGYRSQYITDSYGTNSPDTVWDDGAYLVNPSGDVDVDYGNDYRNIVYDSYGSPYTGWMQYSLANLLSPEGEIILTDGSISVFDSYGKYSICLYIIRMDKYNLVFI